jgi:transcription antitermination factor NusG
VVPALLIAQLKRRISAIQAAGGLVLADLAAGDPVKITSGPFAGYEAIFDLSLKGSDRVRVLLEILRRQVPVELDAGSIRKVTTSDSKRPARTRR